MYAEVRDLLNQKSVDTPYLSTLFSETKSEHQQLKKYRKEMGANRNTIAAESLRMQKIFVLDCIQRGLFSLETTLWCHLPHC